MHTGGHHCCIRYHPWRSPVPPLSNIGSSPCDGVPGTWVSLDQCCFPESLKCFGITPRARCLNAGKVTRCRDWHLASTSSLKSHPIIVPWMQAGLGEAKVPRIPEGGRRSEATRPLRIPELRWGSQFLVHATKPDQAWCRAWSGFGPLYRCGWGAGTSRFLPSVRLLRGAYYHAGTVRQCRRAP